MRLLTMHQVVVPVPAIVDGMIELPECPALASLMDWDSLRKRE